MIDTTHIPDSITPVIGWRAWNTTDDGWLLSLTTSLYDGGRWLPLRETARCHLSRFHPAPQPDCSCGFHTLSSLPAAVEMLPESRWVQLYNSDNPSCLFSSSCHVAGTVELTGYICAHEGGWRAQYAKVRSLNYLRIFFPRATNYQVALDYINKLSTNYPGTMSPAVIVDLVGEDPAPEPRRVYLLDDDQEIHDYIPLGFSKGEAVLKGRQWIYQLRLMDITGGRFDNFERPITLFNAEYFQLQDLEREREVSNLLAISMGWGGGGYMWIDWINGGIWRPDGGLHTVLAAASPGRTTLTFRDPDDVTADYSPAGTILKFEGFPKGNSPLEEATNNVRPWKVQSNVPGGSAGWGGHEIHSTSLDAGDHDPIDAIEHYRNLVAPPRFPHLPREFITSSPGLKQRVWGGQWRNCVD